PATSVASRSILSLLSIFSPRPPTSTLFPYTTLFRSHCQRYQITFCRTDLRNCRKLVSEEIMLKLKTILVCDHLSCIKCRRIFCQDRKSTRLNSSHVSISYAVFCLKKKHNRG